MTEFQVQIWWAIYGSYPTILQQIEHDLQAWQRKMDVRRWRDSPRNLFMRNKRRKFDRLGWPL